MNSNHANVEMFNAVLNYITDQPEQLMVNQEDSLPKDWSISHYDDKPKNRDIYNIFWRQVCLGKVKIYRNEKPKEVKLDNDGRKIYLNYMNFDKA